MQHSGNRQPPAEYASCCKVAIVSTPAGYACQPFGPADGTLAPHRIYKDRLKQKRVDAAEMLKAQEGEELIGKRVALLCEQPRRLLG